MVECKNLYIKKLVSGFSVTLLIAFFCLFASVSYVLHSGSARADTVFIELKPEPAKNSEYPVYRVQKLQKTLSHITAQLLLESSGSNRFGANLNLLNFKTTFIDKNIIRVQITDKLEKQWQVDKYSYYSMYSTNNYDFLLNNYPFSFQIKDKSDGSMVFDSIGSDFYFSERYLELGTLLTAGSIRFGIGERRGNLQLENGNYSLWTSLEASGHFPLLVEVRNKTASGVFLQNFNAMEISLDSTSLKFKTTGGVIDLFIFLGKNVEEVTRSFHIITGLPDLPNFLDLGYHYGENFKTFHELQETLNFFIKNEIPIDRLWLLNSTNSSETLEIFPEFNDLQDFLMQNNIGLVSEISSEITESSQYYSDLKEIFLPYTAQGPNGPSHFIDWFSPNSFQTWSEVLQNFSNSLNFSGLSLKNNEVFTGELKESKVQSLPFKPVDVCLECGAIPLNVSHVNGYSEVDLHSLWGFMQVAATKEFFGKKNVRQSVFSSSTKPGIKGFKVFQTAHANWDLFRENIVSVMNFEIFGVRSGANICSQKTLGRVEICLRWHQVAVFFPLMINEKDEGISDSQIFGGSYLYLVKEAIFTRYTLSLYIYSLYFEASLHGGTIMKPMIFEFMEQECINYPYQLMLGSSLLGIFSVSEKNLLIPVYLPTSLWYNLKSGRKEQGKSSIKNFEIANGFIILIKAGSVIPLVQVKNIYRIKDVRNQSLTLIIALTKDFYASGTFYVDDGVSADTLQKKMFTKVQVTVHKSESLKIKITSLLLGYVEDFKTIDKIRVFGCSAVRSVETAGVSLDFLYERDVLEISLGVNTYSKTEINVSLI